MLRTLAVLAALITGCAGPGRSLVPDIQHHQLDNGLDVYLLQDDSAPLFTFQYWVKVGSADEHEGEPGITGLSHFFEHMMFRGTERYPDYFQEISARGGQLNAFTWLDVTVYWDKLAKEYLDFVLDIESDRLRHMTIDFLNLEPEREVVKSERLLRTENSASGSLYEAMGATLFQEHSYHWPTVGWMRDLNAIPVEEARRYHSRFYVPNNAFIVLVGDFEPSEALQKIPARFGGFERGEVDRPERKDEPPQTRTRRIFVEKPTGTGLFQVAYQAPAGGHEDYATMQVIQELLSGGKASRLQKALVYGDDPLAKEVSGFVFPFVDPGPLSFEVEMLPGKANRLAEERIEQEIARLRTELVDEKELQKAVALLRGDVVRGMATTHSRAQMIGFAVRATGDPALPWKRLEEYGEVTPESVRRIARKYLAPEKRTIGHAVDPARLLKLTEALTTAHPSDLDPLLIETVELLAAERRLQEAMDAALMEKRAIAHLRDRAELEKKRLESDPKAVEAIDQYMTEGEKGADVREAQLKKRMAGLQGQAETLEAKRAEIEEKVTASGEPADPRAAARYGMARSLLGHKSTRGPAPEEPVALAEWALEGLVLRLLADRTDLEPVAPALAAAEPSDGILLDLWNYAHTAQRVDAGRM